MRKHHTWWVALWGSGRCGADHRADRVRGVERLREHLPWHLPTIDT
ncbi:hypothetical protein [Nocardiopsis xinjiangensis]|nr:hypothetical protein [Nocardiopsis xinjiangensis]